MSARDRLFEAMAGGWSLTHAEAASLYRILDDVLDVHAHELAEKIRQPPEDSETFEGMRQAADLIDPFARTGPVRPDEEPT